MKAMQAFGRTVLARYGQGVTLVRDDGSRETGRALLQPVMEKSGAKEQTVPTVLGVKSTDAFLYLGAPELCLENTEYLVSRGREYVVLKAHPVWVGAHCTHWWGILALREEGEP